MTIRVAEGFEDGAELEREGVILTTEDLTVPAGAEGWSFITDLTSIPPIEFGNRIEFYGPQEEVMPFFNHHLEQFKLMLAAFREKYGRDALRLLPQGKLLDAVDSGALDTWHDLSTHKDLAAPHFFAFDRASGNDHSVELGVTRDEEGNLTVVSER